MITIHKFTLEIEDRQTVRIPGFISVLSIIEQYSDIVLYAVVNTEDKKLYKIDVGIAGTGHDVDTLIISDWEFVGTVKQNNGHLVWHIYVKVPK